MQSDAELAESIGVQKQSLSQMRHGQRAISPETVVALCDVIECSGDECREWVAVALLENPKNAGRVAMLRRALFACWVAGVAALTSAPIDAEANSHRLSGHYSPLNRLHIVALLLGMARWLSASTRRPRPRLSGLPARIAAAG